MKKTLLTILTALPFLVNAQVANPEKVYTALPNTGYSATATSEQGSNPASLAVDGDNTTFWESGGTLPHELSVTFPSSKTIAGVYIVDRNNQGNSLKTCTVETFNGTTWTQQGLVYTLITAVVLNYI